MDKFFTPISVAVIIIACYFFFLTRKSWSEKVDKLKFLWKRGDLQASDGSQQSNQPLQEPEEEKLNKRLASMGVKTEEEFVQFLANVDTELKKKDSENSENKNTISMLIELFENYKFGFLNYYLVLTSKIALLWFYNQPSTKRNYVLNFLLPNTVENKDAEKEAIFNALLSHGLLIKNSNDQYMVTPHGIKFLISLQFINPIS